MSAAVSNIGTSSQTVNLIKQYLNDECPDNFKIEKLKTKVDILEVKFRREGVCHLCYALASTIFGFVCLAAKITIFSLSSSALFALSIGFTSYQALSFLLKGKLLDIRGVDRDQINTSTLECTLTKIMKGHLAYIQTPKSNEPKPLDPETFVWIHSLHSKWDSIRIQTTLHKLGDTASILRPEDSLIIAVNDLVEAIRNKDNSNFKLPSDQHRYKPPGEMK